MTAPTKDQVLEWLDARFQTKPDHTWDSLSQLVLDLYGLEVTAPIIIPEKQQSMLSVQIVFPQNAPKSESVGVKCERMRSHLGVCPLLKASFLSSSSL